MVLLSLEMGAAWAAGVPPASLPNCGACGLSEVFGIMGGRV